MIPDLYLREQSGPDALVEGHYLIQLRRSGRVDVPVKIWFGAPSDPDTGELLDRSWRWNILIAGVPFDGQAIRVGRLIEHLSDFWPSCATDPIDETEYRERMDLQEWAMEHAPDDAFAREDRKVDPLTVRLPF